MSSKKFLGFINSGESVNRNKQLQHQSQLLKKDFNCEYNLEELKRKIDTISRYQKPYISTMLNKLLIENPILRNARNCIQLSEQKSSLPTLLLCDLITPISIMI